MKSLNPPLPFPVASPSGSSQLKCLDVRDPEYRRVSQLFLDQWTHPISRKPKPKVCAVYEILLPQQSIMSYLMYKTSVQASSRSSQKIRLTANEKFLFHGTGRLCCLGEERSNLLPCTLGTCRLCSIIRGSYDIQKCGTNHKFSRFGTGVYTTSCSSKADDYVSNDSTELEFRAVLLNRVIVGRSQKLWRTDRNITGPPAGHHSIAGKVGQDLNYPETVVYRNDAIRPAYVVVYGHPPQEVEKPASKISKLFRTPLAT